MASETFDYLGWRIELQNRVGDWVAFIYSPGAMMSEPLIVRSEDEGGRQAALNASRAYIDARIQGREQP